MQEYGFTENKALTGELFPIGKLYEGVPKLEVEEMGLTSAEKLKPAEYRELNPLEKTKETIINLVKNNPDEVLQQKISKSEYNLVYLRHFNDKGSLYSAYVKENFSVKKSRRITDWGELKAKEVDKMRTKSLLIKNNKPAFEKEIKVIEEPKIKTIKNK